MDRTKALTACLIVIATTGCSRNTNTIVVASKNFTEQVILGEIIAQHLENRLERPVERKLNLGGTLLAHNALTGGQIDVYPEYSGTGLAAVLKEESPKDAAKLLAQVRAGYRTRFGIEWLDPLGIDNRFAMVVRGPFAREKQIRTISEAAALPAPWKLGVGYEFEQRPDGLPALSATYPLKWVARPTTMDLGLLFEALAQDQVNMVAANSTDGVLAKMDLTVLEDDRNAFPPYEVCILARTSRLAQITGFREALEDLSGKFNNVTMQRLNFRVDAEHTPVDQVAAEFLKSTGLSR